MTLRTLGTNVASLNNAIAHKMSVRDVTDFGADWTGAADSSAAITAAIADLPANGGVIYFPQRPGTANTIYSCASQINADSKRAITFRGPGAQRTSGATPPVVLKFTQSGSASLLSVRATSGIALENLWIEYTNSAFTGILVDNSGIAGTGDSAMFTMDRCMLVGVSAAGQTATLLSATASNGGRATSTHFTGGGVHVQGMTASQAYSNGWWFDSNYHHTAAIIPFRNPGQGWRIGGEFEPLQDGRAGLCDVSGLNSGLTLINDPLASRGLEIGAETWCGDVTSSTPSSWITWAGYGLTVNGYIGGTSNATAVTIAKDGCVGIDLTGAQIDQCGTGIDFGLTAGHAAVDLRAAFRAVTTAIAGTTPPGALYDNGSGTSVGDALRAAPAGKNKLTTAQATDASGAWGAFDVTKATVARVTSGAPAGTTAFSRSTVIVAGPQDIRLQQWTGSLSSLTAVTAGEKVTPVCYVRSSVSRNCDIFLQAHNASGTQVATSTTVAQVASTTTGWKKLTGSTYTVPAGAVYVSIYVRFSSTLNGETHDVMKPGILSGSATRWVAPAAVGVELNARGISQAGTNLNTHVDASGTGQVVLNGVDGGTGGMSVGDGAGNKLLEVTTAGTVLSTPYATKTADYTLTSADDLVVVTTSANTTQTLPSAAAAGAGRSYAVKNTGTGVTTVAATAGTLDGPTSLATGNMVRYESDGTNWVLVDLVADTGFPPWTMDPRQLGSLAALAANQAVYLRVRNRGLISKIALHVGVSSGNIDVGVFANNGSVGTLGRPLVRRASSGSTACPVAGYAEVALGSSVYVNEGDWFGLVADNATATFYRTGTSGFASSVAQGVSQIQSSAFPLPAPAGPSATGTVGSFILVGVA